MTSTRRTTNLWRKRLKNDLPCSWTGRIKIAKMAMLPKAIYIFNAIHIKIPNDIHHRDWKLYPKVHLKTQKTVNSKTILSKKSNCAAIIIPDYQVYYRAIAIKTVWYWHKNRYEDQWNWIEVPHMNPCNYAHLIFDKVVKNIWWRKDSLFNKCCWEMVICL
jgi:hypothetical protein